MRKLLLASVAALALTSVMTSSAVAAPGQYQAPRKYYLALGDSVAFGFEQARFDAEFPNIDASTFNTGYVDDFAAAIHGLRPSVTVVNFGCPGETTASYFVGCTWHTPTLPDMPSLPLHDDYTGSQSAAALAFLNAHPGEVSPITIDLGANDVTAFAEGVCHLDAVCIANGIGPVLQAIGARLTLALSELRAAAPRAEIIVMQYYNPLYVLSPSSDAFVPAFSETIAAAAESSGARLADTFPVINHNPEFPSELASVCGLTGMCSPPPGGDIHPNDAGYQFIAQQFWAASGYANLD